jgi:Fe-S cluster assembly iron-binding protein IscA
MATAKEYDKILFVGDGGNISKIVFNVTDTIATDGEKEYKLDLGPRNGTGAIYEVYYRSASTDCDVWLSEVEGAAATDTETLIYMKNINVGYSPELTTRRFYINRDNPKSNHLYLTISNNTGGEITTWDFTITKENI